MEGYDQALIPLASLGRAAVTFDRGDFKSAMEFAERCLRRLPAQNRIDRAAALELLIRSQRDAGQVLVAVQDSGTGIDPDKMHRMFDAFFTTKPSGMGMGLSISRSIIEAHGGRLWAAGNTPHGAIFHFCLPVADTTRRTDHPTNVG